MNIVPIPTAVDIRNQSLLVLITLSLTIMLNDFVIGESPMSSTIQCIH